jgi:ABC-type Fe3+ transport system permease subunit
MGTVAELIPQVFFDIYARYVPGLVLFGSWILLLGQDAWQGLLNTVAGGQLDSKNALPIATLILLFVPFVVGYVIAPLAKLVQRGNEHGWWLPPSRSRSVYEASGKRRPKDWWVISDKGAGKG